uniref:Uncharacterized protein n=1 Tax=Tanacetum cinerariifolium TaxID=118510 RepID=A0A699GW15_TANCI|nr:hypothetical protein [Tanacetum cinerariifolium]
MENKDDKKTNKMSYPRFTKIIIDYFMSKDQSISRRNKMFWHTARDDTMFTTIRCISKHEKTQVYGTILSKELTNPTMLESKAYKTYYAFASGEKTPKPNKKEFRISHASGSRDGVDTQSKVPDEQQLMTFGTAIGIGKPGVSDIPKYDSKSDKEYWGDSDEEDDDEDDFEDDVNNSDDISDEGDDDNYGNNGNDGDDDDDANDDDKQESDDKNDDDEETDSDRTKSERIKIPILVQSTTEFYEEEEEEEKINDEETMKDEEDDESGFEQEEEDTHVTLTPVLDTQKTSGLTQRSSVSFKFTSKLLNLDNPSPADNEIAFLMDTTTHHATSIPEITSSFTTPTPLPPLFFNPLLQQATTTLTPTSLETTTSLPALPNFAYVFKFNKKVSNLEKDLSEMKQVDQVEAQVEKREYIELVDSTILIDKIEKNKLFDIDKYKRELYDALVKSYNTDKDIFESYDRRTKRGKLSKEAEPYRDSRSKEKKSLSTSKNTSKSQHKSFEKSANAKEPSHTIEDSRVQQDQVFDTGNNDEQPPDKELTNADWFKKPKRPLTPDPN